MTTSNATDLVQQAVLTALIVAAPILVVGVLVGILVSIAQTLFQIQDGTVSTVFKLAATGLVLLMLLPWMTDYLVAFSRETILNIPAQMVSND